MSALDLRFQDYDRPGSRSQRTDPAERQKSKETISDTDTGPEDNVVVGMGLVGALYGQGGQGRPWVSWQLPMAWVWCFKEFSLSINLSKHFFVIHSGVSPNT